MRAFQEFGPPSVQRTRTRPKPEQEVVASSVHHFIMKPGVAVSAPTSRARNAAVVRSSAEVVSRLPVVAKGQVIPSHRHLPVAAICYSPLRRNPGVAGPAPRVQLQSWPASPCLREYALTKPATGGPRNIQLPADEP